MPRYKLTIEYDGRPFVGWQIQDNGPTVQGVLAAAAEAFTGEKVVIYGAGRTDAGVHALAQVGHVDLSKAWDTDTVRDALNAHLRPHPVAVITAEQVPDTFDARFSAVKRHYLYRIINRRADLTAPGASRSCSTAPPCMRRRSAWSAGTTSPPSATSNARRNRR
jgi:tRNA pseudouridine38-40 synthase